MIFVRQFFSDFLFPAIPIKKHSIVFADQKVIFLYPKTELEQIEDLKAQLKSTGDAILAECAVKDHIYHGRSDTGGSGATDGWNPAPHPGDAQYTGPGAGRCHRLQRQSTGNC